jgi:hypothetical protein
MLHGPAQVRLEARRIDVVRTSQQALAYAMACPGVKPQDCPAWRSRTDRPGRAGGSTRHAMTLPRGLITIRDDGPGCGGEVWLLHFLQNKTVKSVEEIRGHSKDILDLQRRWVQGAVCGLLAFNVGSRALLVIWVH